MRPNHLFYDSSINFKELSFSKLLFAIIIGLLSSLTIYSFFYVLREAFRFMSIGFGSMPSIISEGNRNYYNLFFAGLSVVFGNSIAYNLIFSRPQRITHRFNPKRKRLLNDNIFLSFNFSYWFTKLGLVFGIFSMCCMDFEFLPYFKPISFLLLLVLYLESNKNLLSLLSNNKKLLFYLIHLPTIVLITFLIGKLNVVDYKKMDDMMLSKNPNVKLPHSKFYNDDYSYNAVINLKLKVDSLNKLNIYSNNRKFALEEIPALIMSERSATREEIIPFMVVNIEADKDMNLNYIKLVESQLTLVNQLKISYAVYTDDLTSRFERKSIARRINPEFYNTKLKSNFIQVPLIPRIKLKEFKRDHIKDSALISIGKNIMFNGISVDNFKLKNLFKENQSKEFLFIYQLKGNATYQNYINVTSSHFEAINELRKENQTIFKKYKYDNSESYKKEQRMLRDSFPIRIEERIHDYMPIK